MNFSNNTALYITTIDNKITVTIIDIITKNILETIVYDNINDINDIKAKAFINGKIFIGFDNNIINVLELNGQNVEQKIIDINPWINDEFNENPKIQGFFLYEKLYYVVLDNSDVIVLDDSLEIYYDENNLTYEQIEKLVNFSNREEEIYENMNNYKFNKNKNTIQLLNNNMEYDDFVLGELILTCIDLCDDYKLLFFIKNNTRVMWVLDKNNKLHHNIEADVIVVNDTN